MVYRVYQAVDLPLIGVGGIGTAEDALDFLMAGASAVQVGSANYASPGRRSTCCGGWSDAFAGEGPSPTSWGPPTRNPATSPHQQEAPPGNTKRGFARWSLCAGAA